MKTESTVYILSKQFALRIIKLYKFLTEEKHEYIMSKQIYRSGTSIGANFAESKFASSRADYLNICALLLKRPTKLYIGLNFFGNQTTSNQKNLILFPTI